MASNQALPHYQTCPDRCDTEEGMTAFSKKFRDLPYCANEGARPECVFCAQAKRFGSAPPWKWGTTYTTPSSFGD